MVTQQLRALDAFAEVPDSVPKTHMAPYSYLVPGDLFWPLREQARYAVHIYTCKKKMFIHIKINKSFVR